MIVYIRCGRGRRVAHLDHVTPRGWRGHVWIDAAHRWTWSVLIKFSRILGDVDRRDPVARRAIRSASPGRPRCRHTTHQALLGSAVTA